jgi:hypothetical protein
MEMTSQTEKPISFVIAVNNEEVFRTNVLASPIFHEGHSHQLIVKRNYSSASLAYNDAIAEAGHDLMVFMHQDIYLPEGWDKRLQDTVDSLAASGRKWGVLGCYGVALDGGRAGHIFSNGLRRELGSPQPPVPVQSLDESVLILQKSRGVRFDPELPHFHLYGADICLEARRCGLENFAIGNYCVHNSLPVKRLPPEFWQCAQYLRNKWKNELPVMTCCTTIHSRAGEMWLTRAMTELRHFRKRRRFMVSQRMAKPEAVVR